MTNLTIIRSLLTHEECERVVQEAEQQGFEPMAARYPPSYRNNDRILTDDAQLAQWLTDRLAERLPQQRVGNDGRAWRLRGLNSRFRICRYRGGQRFSVHRDGAYAPTGTRRSLTTVMVYLNEPPAFAGGSTRFYANGTSRQPWRKVTPERGAALVFDHDLWHDGEAVTGGTKYVLRTDVLYDTQEAAATEHRGYVYSLAACPDGSLASGSRDATIRMARGTSSGVLRGHRSSVTALAWHGNAATGALWSGARDGELRRWDREGVSTRMRNGGAAILCMASAADSREVDSRRGPRPDEAIYCGTSAGAVERWTSAGMVSRTSLHRSWVWGLVLDDGTMFTCSEDGSMRCTSYEHPGAHRRSWHAFLRTPLRALAVRQGKVVAAGANGVIYAWSPDGRPHPPVGKHDAPICALAITDHGVVAGDESGVVKLWRHQGGCAVVTQHQDQVRGIVVRGGQLFTASYDGTVRATPLPDSLVRRTAAPLKESA